MPLKETSFEMTPAAPDKSVHDDRALFCLIASDDEQAFKEIFTRFRPRVISYLIRITKSPSDAEELTQEIFLKLWANRQSLASVKLPEHYIFVMAKNKAMDHVRKAALDSRMRRNIWIAIRERSESADEQAIAFDAARLIREATAKLSSQRQTVLRLSRVEGLTHDQIAVQLSISKNTVKNHIVASTKFIRDYLSDRH